MAKKYRCPPPAGGGEPSRSRGCLGPLSVPKIPPATLALWGVITQHGDRGAEGRARRLTCAERHERVTRGVSAPRCVFGHLRGLCEVFECP